MIYVVSDLHGYPLEDFLRLLARADFGPEDELYVLGDVIDRNGDGGVALLRWLMRQPNAELLLGNHEAMLLGCAFLFDEVTQERAEALRPEEMGMVNTWLMNGAEPTLRALRALHREDPDALGEVLDYLRCAPLYAAVTAGGKDFVLVHAGLGDFDPARRLRSYRQEELLWHRPEPDERYWSDVTTVFGHTPTGYYGSCYAGEMLVTDTWIDVDVGAADGKPPLLLRLDDMQTFRP